MVVPCHHSFKSLSRVYLSVWSIILVGELAVVTGYKVNAYDGPQGWVEDHNYYRCLHGADPIVWDSNLADKAQAWVNELAKANGALTHSQCYYTWPYSGENLSKGPTGQGNFQCNGQRRHYDQHCALYSWYKEYGAAWDCVGDWTTAKFGDVGHFTAMVWKGIGRVGCASNGDYYGCEYGHKLCYTKGLSLGGRQCYGTLPQHLPNFSSCKGSTCVGCYDGSKVATCASQTSAWNLNDSAQLANTGTQV